MLYRINIKNIPITGNFITNIFKTQEASLTTISFPLHHNTISPRLNRLNGSAIYDFFALLFTTLL